MTQTHRCQHFRVGLPPAGLSFQQRARLQRAFLGALGTSCWALKAYLGTVEELTRPAIADRLRLRLRKSIPEQVSKICFDGARHRQILVNDIQRFPAIKRSTGVRYAKRHKIPN
jgi:hypothetical protein